MELGLSPTMCPHVVLQAQRVGAQDRAGTPGVQGPMSKNGQGTPTPETQGSRPPYRAQSPALAPSLGHQP